MSMEQLKPPTPQVLHLPTILRKIQTGELRVPAFQRAFVWKEKEVRELLLSVYKGYPIGSLLFWNTTEVKLAVEKGERFPFPAAPPLAPTSFVLDGMQRLATLYNCFFPVDAGTFPEFNVAFDLRSKEFLHVDADGALPPSLIRLRWLFSPKDFLAAQGALSRESDADALLNDAIALHARFQEYQVPTVTIEGRSITEVVEIFERINNTGAKLSAVDFMRAVTWSELFDLTRETGEWAKALEQEGFEVPQETLVKLVAISLDRDPSLEQMLKLRDTSADRLTTAVKEAANALRQTMAFLHQSFRILSYEYVPYEAQLLVLCKLMMVSKGAPSPVASNAARRWFWATSFNESLQGKADSVIAGLLKAVTQLASGDTKKFDVRIEVEPTDITTRTFIVRRAISSALGMLFAAAQARSVVTGNAIPTEDYMAEFSSVAYWPVFTQDDLEEELDGRVQTARFIPNMIVVSPEDRAVLRKAGVGGVHAALSKLPADVRRTVLQSQAISQPAFKLMGNKGGLGFFNKRAEDIVAASRTLLG